MNVIICMQKIQKVREYTYLDNQNNRTLLQTHPHVRQIQAHLGMDISAQYMDPNQVRSKLVCNADITCLRNPIQLPFSYVVTRLQWLRNQLIIAINNFLRIVNNCIYFEKKNLKESTYNIWHNKHVSVIKASTNSSYFIYNIIKRYLERELSFFVITLFYYQTLIT